MIEPSGRPNSSWIMIEPEAKWDLNGALIWIPFVAYPAATQAAPNVAQRSGTEVAAVRGSPASAKRI
jgi:hypothetical protein